jgi:hypothetical protein
MRTPASFEDILSRLSEGECHKNYPARIISKSGANRYSLINSNVYFKDGEFLHTRCFTLDVPKDFYDYIKSKK